MPELGRVDATRSSKDPFSNMPPILIHHGGNDSYTPVSSSKNLYQTLKDNGRNVEIHIYKGVGKYFIDYRYRGVYHPKAADESWKLTLAFLDKHLKTTK